MRTKQTQKVIGFRPTPDDLQRLDALAAKTGLPRSDIFRALIRAADATPVVSWVPVVKPASAEVVTR